MRRHFSEYSKNQSIERAVANVLASGLPADAGERAILLRLHLGDQLCQMIELAGGQKAVADRLAVKLLRDFGGLGRDAMARLLRNCADDSPDERWAEAAKAAAEGLEDYEPVPFQVDEEATAIEPRQLHSAIRHAVRHDGAPVRVTPATVNAVADGAVATFEDYLTRCIADAERQPAVDERFVALSLLIDRRVNGKATGPERFTVERGRYDSLQEALDDNEDCELVIVGPPGAGKSTLCARLRLQLCRAAVMEQPVPLPFLVHLGDYGKDDGALPDPQTWLERQWAEVMPGVPLASALAERPFVILLDALNEMPREDEADLGPRIEAWQRWLERFHARTEGRHRVVFTCRIRDLSASLSSRTRSVRLLEIDSLDDDRVHTFIDEHAGAYAERIRERLKKSQKLRDLYRTPLSLTLLLDLIELCGVVPESPAALFTGHVCHALKRELEARNRRFAVTEGLLSRNDIAHMARHPYDVDEPYLLPDEGPLFRALGALAYAMQKGDATERSHVVMKRKQARHLYEGLAVSAEVDFETLLAAGADLGLIGQHTNKIAFVRQPHQEYLAARAWAEAGADRDYELVRLPWSDDNRDLDAVINGLLEDDPLPAAPATGWEETVLMGAEMAEDDGVIDGLEAVHPALAGRAAALRSDDGRKVRLRRRLLGQCQNPGLDLRVRIQAGAALGALGHPEFVEHQGPFGRYLEPPMVLLPGGEFTVGDENYVDERPVHHRRVGSFRIGRYPVTRAEFACFVDAGGYKNPRWWVTPEARRWFDGVGVGQGTRKNIAEFRARVQNDPALLAPMTPPQRKYWQAHRDRSEAELTSWLDEHVESGKQTEPWEWTNGRYQVPTFPAIGICSFEALAYIEWLNSQTGGRFRLPDEFEWERAARGLRPSKVFPAGDDLDAHRHANVYDSHIRGLTPVGIYPAGSNAEGVADLAGNIWEWTGSLWTKDHKTTDRSETLRVVRGGSWDFPMQNARGACRHGFPLDNRYSVLGFRLCLPSPQSDS